MITNNHNDERDLDITDLPTDEYPVLSEAALSLGQAGAEPDGADARARTNAPVRAALSLTHLEAEVSRLQSKWQSIDAEFKNREARIAELHEEIKARDSTIVKLTADVADDAVALQGVHDRLAGKEVEIAALIRERNTRDERIGALSKDIEEADGRQKDLLEKLAHAAAETARLNDLVLREQTLAASVEERNRQMLTERDALQGKLQDLEIYINGRHDRWAELNAELVAHKDALRGKEETIKALDATIAQHDDEKRRLTDSIHELERQCSELIGRRKEREEAYEELQKKLAAHHARTEQLRGEYAARAKETEHAGKLALESRQQVESLERDIAQRDTRIEALTAQLEQDKAAIGELTTTKADLGRRADELEKRSAELVQQVQALNADLRAAHDQLRLAQQQLSDRTAQLASSQEALENKAREANRLTDERDAAQRESVRVRIELDELSAHAAELGRLRTEGSVEVRQLKSALTARNDRISELETELRVKQATADILERSVSRITDLGASLAALDERMNGGEGRADAKKPGAEALPLDLDVGERSSIEAGRKLVVTIDGKTFDYPILKKQMTIGRGQGTDIRVASHFVSRVHATIKINGTSTIIEDAGSKNGVLVNAERVVHRALHDGDVVTLGDDLNMRFVDATH